MSALRWLCALICASLLSCDTSLSAAGSSEGDPELMSAWVALGRHLFYERRLSLNEDRSCGICHEQAKGFTDGFVRAVGTTAELHPRNTTTLINVAARSSLGWVQPAPSSLEEQLLTPLLGEQPIEMGLAEVLTERLEALNQDRVYQGLIAPLKLDQLKLDHISIAIAHFERTISSYQAPYDAYLLGERDALSPAAQRGLTLFTEVLACGACHGGRDFDQPLPVAQELQRSDARHDTTRHGWFNTGLYHLDDGRYPMGREGLFELTGEREDIGRYRVPTLRNLAFTAPYYHDGSGASLEDVLRDYNQGGRVTRSGPYVGDGRTHPNKHPLIQALALTDLELQDLRAFLLSLSDESIVSDPRLADPWPR